MLPIRRILVPVDFSAPSRAALAYAARIAADAKAALHVLHVWEEPRYSWSGGGEIAGDAPTGHAALGQFVRTRAGAELERLLREIEDAAHVRVFGRLDMGDPFEAILKAAKTGGFDLVVMGTHGRTGLAHVLLGSVAERVVRHAPCPVLTLRTPPAVAEGASVHPEGSAS
jgi:universal stress protein A